MSTASAHCCLNTTLAMALITCVPLPLLPLPLQTLEQVESELAAELDQQATQEAAKMEASAAKKQVATTMTADEKERAKVVSFLAWAVDMRQLQGWKPGVGSLCLLWWTVMHLCEPGGHSPVRVISVLMA